MIPLRDDIGHRRFPVINWLLIASNILVFLLQKSGAVGEEFAAVPARIVSGQDWHTIPTSMFMHGGMLHIIGNMWFLHIFGDNVEDAFSHIGYLLVYLAAGFCGALLQIMVAPSSTVPMVGASGAISGVLGAYMVLYPGARILTLVPVFVFLQFVNIPAILFLGFWILIQILSGLGAPRAGGGIAFFAHIGGFAFGFLAGLFARIFLRPRRLRYTVY
ncbi:MAG: rhomboid family intramembrane serine protease [candidate division WOR-3 bacterium]